MAGDSEPAGGICRKCCLEVTPDTTIRLWDGKDYCEKCVEEACPGLAEYARTHETLEEKMPHSAWRIGVNIALVGMTGMLGFGVLLWLLGIWHGADPMAPESLFLLLLFPVGGLPIAVLFGVANGVGFAINRPIASVKDGQLGITVGRDTETMSLLECEWYIGKTWHMSYPTILNQKTVLLHDRAIVIILPRSLSRWECSRRVATGFTRETRQRWKSFLILAAVPRRIFGLPRDSSF